MHDLETRSYFQHYMLMHDYQYIPIPTQESNPFQFYARMLNVYPCITMMINAIILLVSSCIHNKWAWCRHLLILACAVCVVAFAQASGASNVAICACAIVPVVCEIYKSRRLKRKLNLDPALFLQTTPCLLAGESTGETYSWWLICCSSVEFWFVSILLHHQLWYLFEKGDIRLIIVQFAYQSNSLQIYALSCVYHKVQNLCDKLKCWFASSKVEIFFMVRLMLNLQRVTWFNLFMHHLNLHMKWNVHSNYFWSSAYKKSIFVSPSWKGIKWVTSLSLHRCLERFRLCRNPLISLDTWLNIFTQKGRNNTEGDLMGPVRLSLCDQASTNNGFIWTRSFIPREKYNLSRIFIRKKHIP